MANNLAWGGCGLSLQDPPFELSSNLVDMIKVNFTKVGRC
jgi:hypothetical protein